MTEHKPPIMGTSRPPMTHEKALELITHLKLGLITLDHPDVKTALTIAQAALITEKLHLERG